MKALSRSFAVLALLTASLAGCGGSSGDDAAPMKSAAPSTAKPATGDTITTDDYSYVVPEGWKELEPESIPGFAFDSVARSDKAENGFADNINVLHDKSIVGVEGDKLEDAAKSVLKGYKATDITIKDRAQIDGEEAVHVGAIFAVNSITYRTEQYALSHDGKGYVVTVSFRPDVPSAERDKVSESILTTWKWKS